MGTKNLLLEAKAKINFGKCRIHTKIHFFHKTQNK